MVLSLIRLMFLFFDVGYFSVKLYIVLLGLLKYYGEFLDIKI